jgi:hypothetical protein
VKSSHESKHSHPISAPCSCLRCAPSKPPLPGETASSRWCFCCPGSSCVLCCCRRAPPANEGDEVEGQSINTTNPDDYDDDINSPRNVAASVLYQCSCMTLQFVLLKPLLAVIPFFFYLGGVAYEEHQYYDIETGAIDWTSPKLYVLMVANISVSLAFYGLLSFYHTTEKGEYFVIFSISILKYHLDPIFVNLIVCCFMIRLGVVRSLAQVFVYQRSCVHDFLAICGTSDDEWHGMCLNCNGV